MGLDPKFITELLQKDKQRATHGRRAPKDKTEPREYSTWWKLPHRLIEAGCQNPGCVDPRPTRGNIVAEVKGELICRYCFLSGYLSTEAK